MKLLFIKTKHFLDETILADDEFLIFEALQQQSQLTIHQVIAILGKKKVMPIVNGLLQKEAIVIKEEIYEQYKPKLVKYVRLHKNYTSDDSLGKLLAELSRAKKQREAVLGFFQLSTSQKTNKGKRFRRKSSGFFQYFKVFGRQRDFRVLPHSNRSSSI